MNHSLIYLALDVGTKTIGLSLGRPATRMAFPYELYRRKSFEKDVAYIVSVIEKECVNKIIVGLPKNMNGTLGPQSDYVKGFVEKLQLYTSKPIDYWDERLSTVAVEKALIAADMSRKKRKNIIDAQAAAFILQGYLDHEGMRG
jgi:putative Holliday junction resolvase